MRGVSPAELRRWATRVSDPAGCSSAMHSARQLPGFVAGRHGSGPAGCSSAMHSARQLSGFVAGRRGSGPAGCSSTMHSARQRGVPSCRCPQPLGGAGLGARRALRCARARQQRRRRTRSPQGAGRHGPRASASW
ncbi:hypothetical protein OAO87_03635 [bacterium]|nr:hypothetical protein [bacterium]